MDSKSLLEKPVEFLYSIYYQQFSNSGNYIKLVKHKVRITRKQIRLTEVTGSGRGNKIHKKDEPFHYDINTYNGYFSKPENAVALFEKAIFRAMEDDNFSVNRKKKFQSDLSELKDQLAAMKDSENNIYTLI